MRLPAHFAFENVGGLVPWNRPIVRDRTRVEKCAITIGVLSSHPPVPHTCDHLTLPDDITRGASMLKQQEARMVALILQCRNVCFERCIRYLIVRLSSNANS